MAAAALVAVWSAGCGRPATLDMDATERTIGERLSEGYGTDVERVRCPGEVKVEVGRSFTCTARLDAGTVNVAVELTDEDGGMTLTPDRARIEISEVTRQARELLAEQTDPVMVACEGPPVRLVPVGETFTCRAGNAGGQGTVEVTVRDWKGGVDFALL